MFFSGITKNLNWEISTKNLFTFKRQDGVKDEKLSYGSSLKNPTFEGVQKTNILGVNFPKKWSLDSYQI